MSLVCWPVSVCWDVLCCDDTPDWSTVARPESNIRIVNATTSTIENVQDPESCAELLPRFTVQWDPTTGCLCTCELPSNYGSDPSTHLNPSGTIYEWTVNFAGQKRVYRFQLDADADYSTIAVDGCVPVCELTLDVPAGLDTNLLEERVCELPCIAGLVDGIAANAACCADHETRIVTLEANLFTAADVCDAVNASCPATAVLNGDGSVTVTGTDGVPQTIADTDTSGVLAENGDGSYTWTPADGSAGFVIPAPVETSLVVTTDGTSAGVTPGGTADHTVDIVLLGSAAADGSANLLETAADGGVALSCETVQDCVGEALSAVDGIGYDDAGNAITVEIVDSAGVALTPTGDGTYQLPPFTGGGADVGEASVVEVGNLSTVTAVDVAGNPTSSTVVNGLNSCDGSPVDVDADRLHTVAGLVADNKGFFVPFVDSGDGCTPANRTGCIDEAAITCRPDGLTFTSAAGSAGWSECCEDYAFVQREGTVGPNVDLAGLQAALGAGSQCAISQCFTITNTSTCRRLKGVSFLRGANIRYFGRAGDRIDFGFDNVCGLNDYGNPNGAFDMRGLTGAAQFVMSIPPLYGSVPFDIAPGQSRDLCINFGYSVTNLGSSTGGRLLALSQTSYVDHFGIYTC